ncbi:hypothetical protein [Escherichia coli]|uniref:hypothetical protein n=1 Tax=Escherichia coli TaxID=562 RepID=UPI0034D2BCF8
MAYLEIRVGDQTRHGVGIDGSIVRASMQAVLSGLSRAQLTVPQHQEENVR